MNILIINDYCSHGQVAINSIKPCLEKTGENIFTIPSCIISSTFNKKNVVISDNTEYLIKCLKIYKDISFDYIIIGFIYNKIQAEYILNFIDKNKNATIVVDPTMADNGKMYKSLNEENLKYIKNLCDVSDIIIPNITEARFLCNDFDSDTDTILHKLENKYNSIIVTSIDNKKIFVSDKIMKTKETFEYKKIQGAFPGTGDLFLALMLSKYIYNKDLIQSSKYAALKIYELIRLEIKNINKYNGIQITKYL